MSLKFYVMLNFSQNQACVATVIMLSQTATIGKDSYKNKISKTTRTKKMIVSIQIANR